MSQRSDLQEHPAQGPVHQDPSHRDRAIGVTGVLADFNRAGVIDAADVRVASRLTELVQDTDPTARLALALAVRAVRTGSVCVDLATVAETVGELGAGLDWPTYEEFVAAVDASPLTGSPPVLRRAEALLYLDRYWLEEEQVCADLLRRAGQSAPPVDEAVLADGLARVFHRDHSEDQRAAAAIAVRQWTTVLTGGPGTGKTTTVAGILALLVEQAEVVGGPVPRIALAAPTGKAAARLQQAIETEVSQHLAAADRERLVGLEARTLHRLLGHRRGHSNRFRHHRGNRLPYDIVVVDETSMVSLTMMARLLEAVRPQARLLLVGDPDQLASIEAGAVLADLVAGLAGHARAEVAQLRVAHRYGSAIGALADAIRDADADRVLATLAESSENVEWIASEDLGSLRQLLLPPALRVHRAAQLGDPDGALRALEEHRLLCAHRDGPYGVRHWNRIIEQWLTEETGEPLWEQWYLGRPVMLTSNDYGLGVYNGDTGVVVAGQAPSQAAPPAYRSRPRVWLSGLDRSLPASRLGAVETMHAMTIHKSQGSQAQTVTVLLPEPDSPLLTRELLYTAVTRAEQKVRLVASAEAIRAAVQRKAQRASGLAERLGREH